MRHFKQIMPFFLILSAWAFMATGCVNENLEGCHTLTLKVVNAKGDDITGSGEAAAACIFVFDANYKYLQTIEMNEDEIVNRREIVVNYPKNSKLHFVAWGNAYTDDYVITKGQTIEEFQLQLASQGGLATAQGQELYYGSREIATGLFTPLQDEEIVIAPKTASVYMWTQGLSNYHDKLKRDGLRSDDGAPFDCEFYLDKTLSKYNHAGTLEGDSVYYNPAGEWTDPAYSDWRTPDFYKIFAGENMSAALELDGQVFDTVLTDDEGNPISPKETEEVLVVFIWADDGSYLGTRVKVRPWSYLDDPIILE